MLRTEVRWKKVRQREMSIRVKRANMYCWNPRPSANHPCPPFERGTQQVGRATRPWTSFQNLRNNCGTREKRAHSSSILPINIAPPESARGRWSGEKRRGTSRETHRAPRASRLPSQLEGLQGNAAQFILERNRGVTYVLQKTLPRIVLDT